MHWPGHGRDRRERELRRELRDHLELEAEDRGGDPDAARRALGNPTLILENTRAEWRGATLVRLAEDARMDLRYAARRMAASPGFTAAAVLTLALGVGLATGAFSLFNGLLLQDLPVPDGHELVRIQRVLPNSSGPMPVFTVAEYETLRDRSTTLAGLLGYASVRGAELGGDTARAVVGTVVSCNYFDVLRQSPVLGRGLGAGDCVPGAPPVVVVGHRLWITVLDADPTIVGSAVTLITSGTGGQERRVFTVVGIAGADTYSPTGPRSDFYVPYGAMPSAIISTRPDGGQPADQLILIGRRGNGASLQQVGAELAVIGADLDADPFGWTRAAPGVEEQAPVPALRVERARRYSTSNVDAIGSAIALALPVALVLLLVCANVTNLFLARATDRRREIAMRLSLGAGRARVVRQLLTESASIAIAGGTLGTLVAFSSFDALLGFVMSRVPDPSERIDVALAVDGRVLAVALALSLVTGLLCGLAPALRLGRLDLDSAIKLDAIGPGGLSRGRLQGALVGLQVAACVVLVAVTGIFLRDLYATYAVEPGFAHQNVSVVRLSRLAGDARAQTAASRDRLVERIRALPGVTAAAWSSAGPWSDAPELSVGLPGQSVDDRPWANVFDVSRGYFATLGLPLVRGREFTDAERAEGSSAAIVSESLARRLWPERDPLGQTLVSSGPPSRRGNAEVTLQVVGVSQDARLERFGEAAPYVIHRPVEAGGTRTAGGGLFLVRRETDSSGLAAEIRTTVRGMDARLEVDVRPLADTLARVRAQSWFAAMLVMSVGGLALLLAAIGIYGVVAYVVNRRAREMAIRLALGARSHDVLGAVLCRTMRPVALGALLGLGGAVALSRVLSGALVATSPTDPLAFGGAVLFVLGVALLASLNPARRGLRVDPMRTLQCE